MNKLALFLLPLALLLGCGGEEGGTDLQDGTGGCMSYNGCGGNGELPPPPTFEATIHAVSPAGMTGNFYIGPAPCLQQQSQFEDSHGNLLSSGNDCTLACENAVECTMDFPPTPFVDVVFRAPNILTMSHFLYPTGNKGNSDIYDLGTIRSYKVWGVQENSITELNWPEEAWALAPNSDYFDNDEGKVKEVHTWIEGGNFMIDLGLNFSGTTVQGLSFIGQSEGGSKLSGEITDDLKSISYELVTPRTTFKGTLTRME